MKLFYIQWVDSSSSAGTWTMKEHLDGKLGICETVGWLVKESKKTITVVSSIAPHEYGGDMTIPKVAIVKRKRIKY